MTLSSVRRCGKDFSPIHLHRLPSGPMIKPSELVWQFALALTFARLVNGSVCRLSLSRRTSLRSVGLQALLDPNSSSSSWIGGRTQDTSTPKSTLIGRKAQASGFHDRRAGDDWRAMETGTARKQNSLTGKVQNALKARHKARKQSEWSLQLVDGLDIGRPATSQPFDSAVINCKHSLKFRNFEI